MLFRANRNRVGGLLQHLLVVPRGTRCLVCQGHVSNIDQERNNTKPQRVSSEGPG